MPFLKEFGHYLPQRIVTSEEAGSWVGATAEWVLNVSGIRERRFAAEDETVADLAAKAGQDCLDRAGYEAKRLGLIVVACGSSERAAPGPASVTALKLGAAGVPAIDLPLASAGSLFGLALAARLSPSMGHILVIGAEKMSRIVAREPKERGVAVLFGDGAGACLVSPSGGKAEIVEVELGSDGTWADDLCLEQNAPIKMNGRTVILQASRKIPGAIRSVLDRAGVAAASIGTFLLHQANQNLIDKVAETLGVESARFFSNIAKYGNTSSASMLIAASEWSRENGFVPGAHTVFAAFGAGFHWGALLAKGCAAAE
jgi:3-oxoacyl-[acyl-carrier-protein] synthase-3